MTFAITLSSTGETMTGLDGSSLSGLDHASAKQLVRELSQVWARELGDDTLEITEEVDAETEADAECEESRLEVARRFRGLAITVSDSGAVGGTERGYYSVLAARGRVIYREPSNYAV